MTCFRAAAAIPKLVAMVFVILLLRDSEAAISCGQVVHDLAPCLDYLSGGSGMPPPNCCSGVKSLASAAKTTADEQAACQCIKSAATASGINLNSILIQDLPRNCRVYLPFPISLSIDCTKIG